MKKQEKYDWMVCVNCMTFNQASYIEDAMSSFTMQKTDFPFVCTIVDDASTDGEQEVIKNYLNEHFDLEDKMVVRHEETDDYVLTFARHKTNLSCHFAVLYLKYNHYKKKSKVPYIVRWRDSAKYIATCEGDDYWIDPLKLQKQYDLMEAHSEYSMCFHAHNDLYPDGKQIKIYPQKIKEKYDAKDIVLIEDNIIGTNTTFYRWHYLRQEGYPTFWSTCPVGDLPLRLFFVSKGFIGYINEELSVYRRNAQGGWTTQNRSFVWIIKHRIKIIRMYKLYDEYTHKNYHNLIKKQINKLKANTLRALVLYYPYKIVGCLRNFRKE